MVTIIKRTFLSVVLALIAFTANADVVYLKTGDKINCQVLNMENDGALRVQLADGSIVYYARLDYDHWEDGVENEMIFKSYNGLDRGYRGLVDVGYAVGMGDNGEGRFEVSTSHGYQLNPYFFVGAGVGLHYFSNSEIIQIPLFAHVRSEFMNKKFSPFVEAKVGYSVYDSAGFYCEPAIGCRLDINDKFGLSLSVGYSLQSVEHMGVVYDEIYDITYDGMVTDNSGALSIKLGIDF